MVTVFALILILILALKFAVIGFVIALSTTYELGCYWFVDACGYYWPEHAFLRVLYLINING